MYTPGIYVLYKEHMNLREAPSARSKSIGVLPRGMTIEVKEVKDNWGRVEGENVSGWCCISECFAQKCYSGDRTCDECPRCAALEAECEKWERIVGEIRGIVQ